MLACTACSHWPRAGAGGGVRVAARGRELLAARAARPRARAAAAGLLHARSSLHRALLAHLLRYALRRKT